MRTKIVVGSLLGAVAIHLSFIACSTVQNSGDVSLIDAALEAETPDALAQDSGGGGPSSAMVANCDQIATQRTVASNYTYTYETFYAVFDVGTLNPRDAPHVSVIACDREVFTPPATTTCTAGATCTQSGFTPPQATCFMSGASFAGTQAIVNCGYRATTMQAGDGGTTTTIQGERSQHAYLRIN